MLSIVKLFSLTLSTVCCPGLVAAAYYYCQLSSHCLLVLFSSFSLGFVNGMLTLKWAAETSSRIFTNEHYKAKQKLVGDAASDALFNCTLLVNIFDIFVLVYLFAWIASSQAAYQAEFGDYGVKEFNICKRGGGGQPQVIDLAYLFPLE